MKLTALSKQIGYDRPDKGLTKILQILVVDGNAVEGLPARIHALRRDGENFSHLWKLRKTRREHFTVLIENRLDCRGAVRLAAIESAP